MPLAAAERGGHSLHPHAARLSLPPSVTVYLSLRLSLLPSAALRKPVRHVPGAVAAAAPRPVGEAVFYILPSVVEGERLAVREKYVMLHQTGEEETTGNAFIVMSQREIIVCINVFKVQYRIHFSAVNRGLNAGCVAWFEAG